MKVTEYFENARGQALVSFEVLPPLKGGSMKAIFDTLDPLMEFKPPFIDVTYHREDFIYKKMPSGYYEKIAIRKRPGTVGICAAIMHRYGVDAVPHLICGGFTREETENALIDLNFLNINNVLALRGDAASFDGRFVPDPNGHEYALDLVKQINGMNRGQYLDDNIKDGLKTEFCIGVAGYPEKHFESPNIATDLAYTKAKVDAGANYIVTQMFFDNRHYFSFVDECRKAGIAPPIFQENGPFAVVTFQVRVGQTAQVTTQVAVQVTTQVAAVLQAASQAQKSREELQHAAGMRNREHFRKAYLEPLLTSGWLERTIPDKPRSRMQKYRTTETGRAASKAPERKS